MDWREIQIFLFGFYSMGTIITLMFIYFEIGSLNQKVVLILCLIFGFGTLPLLPKFSSSREKKNG